MNISNSVDLDIDIIVGDKVGGCKYGSIYSDIDAKYESGNG